MGESKRQRARRLGRVSWEVLRGDRRLFVFPFVSAVVSMLLGAGSFAVSDGLVGGVKHARWVIVLGGIIAAYPVTFVTLFCGVALAEVLARKIAGQDVRASDGWRAARSKLGLIMTWTLLVCTVGALLRIAEERVPFGGRIVAWLLDLSWSLATMFAVPVIAYEGLGPVATLKRSASIFRARWGEQVSGVVTIELGTAILAVPAAVLLVAGLTVGGVSGIVLVVLGGAIMLGVQAFATALNEIYRVFLYRSATDVRPVGGPFGEADLAYPTWDRHSNAVWERR